MSKINPQFERTECAMFMLMTANHLQLVSASRMSIKSALIKRFVIVFFCIKRPNKQNLYLSFIVLMQM